MKLKCLTLMLSLGLPFCALAQVGHNGQVSINFLNGKKVMSGHDSVAAGGGVLNNRSNGSVLGVDSVPNWSSSFYYPGYDSFGGVQYAWQYTMIGKTPFTEKADGGVDTMTTKVGAPVVPVNLDLRNADGTPAYVNGQRLFVEAAPYVPPTLLSPLFQNTTYDSSGVPTQFNDAVQRAEFYNAAKPDWHTLLAPRPTHSLTMTLLGGSYLFALNSDGTCCAFVLIDENAFVNALFPSSPTDTTTILGAAENTGLITTKDMSSFLFPNAYLYLNGDPNQCCVLGFHTYDVEPGSAANGWKEKRYVMDYASWISPGLFGPAFQDVTGLSHELTESFNDPFVNNATPWWLAPNGNCQNNLETGDVIEGLPNATYPITLNGYTYHPQNEALLQYFAGVTPSNAIDQAYSYPDETVLTAPSQSLPPGCQ
ncbi:MAG TPA: hypothetical protein VGD64_04215 [Acidisarcina sp.]